MGYMIGMPCLKLNNVGRKSSSCGGFGAVADEALEERKGKDPDIDQERTADNVYTGFRTSAELQAYSQAHVEELSAELQAQGKRKIREDAVVMIATIIKPPAAFMHTLTRDEQVRFLNDAREKLENIVGKGNVKSTVMHFDEQGGHLHVFWEPMTEDGRLCAKDMCNLKFFKKLNSQMPEFLRSRGWDIDDCQAYDEAKEQLKSEQEKYQERRQRGRSSVVYKAQAEAEKNRLNAEIDELLVEARDITDKITTGEQKLAEIHSKTKQAEKRAIEADERAYEAECHLAVLEERVELIQDYEEYTQKADEIEERTSRLNRFLEVIQSATRIFKEKEAREFIDFCKNEIAEFFVWVKKAFGLVKEFEMAADLPEEQRRSPGLDERIKKAEAQVKDTPWKSQDELRR